MSMIDLTFDGVPFTKFSWDDIAKMTTDLAQQVLASGEEFDRLIALANGGLTMVRHCGDLLNIHTISSMQVKYYVGVNETAYEPLLVQPLPISVQGERVLVFEDVVDTGATLGFVNDYLEKAGAASVAIAAQVVKSHTKVQPRWFAAKHDSWVIFPYETRETIDILTKKWAAQGVPENEIAGRLTQLDLIKTW
jgi:hypoxanthine phosphoribosyltransferase